MQYNPENDTAMQSRMTMKEQETTSELEETFMKISQALDELYQVVSNVEDKLHDVLSQHPDTKDMAAFPTTPSETVLNQKLKDILERVRHQVYRMDDIRDRLRL